MIDQIGPGWSNYNRYDADIAETACQWLKDASQTSSEKPWVLYVGVCGAAFSFRGPERVLRPLPTGKSAITQAGSPNRISASSLASANERLPRAR